MTMKALANRLGHPRRRGVARELRSHISVGARLSGDARRSEVGQAGDKRNGHQLSGSGGNRLNLSRRPGCFSLLRNGSFEVRGAEAQ